MVRLAFVVYKIETVLTLFSAVELVQSLDHDLQVVVLFLEALLYNVDQKDRESVDHITVAVLQQN